MPNVASDFAAILDKVDGPGDFRVSGRGEFSMPRLSVADVGTIALTLLPIQKRDFVAAATRAPHGRGQHTIVDENVRRKA